MTVPELVTLSREWVEDDPMSNTVRLYLINQIEAKYQTELLLIDPNEIVQYETADMTATPGTDPKVLLILEPYTDVYLTWMVANTYWYLGEYNTYQNEKRFFDAAWNRLAKMIALRDHTGSDELVPVYSR